MSMTHARLTMKYLLSPSLLCLMLFMAISCTRDVLPDKDFTYDLLIQNALIIDGTGDSPFLGSLLISNGMILYAGPNSLHGFRAERNIDAAGRVVAPGFIDAHAHGNAEINPVFRNFWAQGVTSIALGMDGASPGIDDLPAWMERVENARPGVNIIHFVGHGTAREYAGLPMVKGAATEEDLDRLTALIESQLEAGSFGVSTGIEYIPGQFADRRELARVAEVVSRFDALVSSHIRNEDDDAVKDSIRELITMGSDGGARVNVSHIKIVYSNAVSDAEEVLAVMDSARTAGVEITADVYPYTASFTGIGILYPSWALPPNDFEQVRRERREELTTYLRNRVNRRNGPEATLLGTAPWSGRTLAQIADSLGTSFEDLLIDHIPPGSASAAYFVMNMDVMRRFLTDPFVSVSSDGSPSMLHPRGYGSFARIIRQFVEEEEILSLEEAVHKMSLLTAQTLRLHLKRGQEQNRDLFVSESGDVLSQETGLESRNHRLRYVPRGILREGFAADVVMFDPSRVRDNATFEDPHQYASGMDLVIVNGVVVQDEGKPTGARPGLVLRR